MLVVCWFVWCMGLEDLIDVIGFVKCCYLDVLLLIVGKGKIGEEL